MVDGAQSGIVVVASAGGAVLRYLLQAETLAGPLVRLVVSDRDCGAVSVAQSHACPVKIFRSSSGKEFSDHLHQHLDSEVAVLSFYTRLFAGRFVRERAGKIFNVHPSLLPAFPGMDGFGDTLKSTSKFMGCTVHQVDEGVDTGPIIIQSALQIDRAREQSALRHDVYLAQTYVALQFVLWCREGRLRVSDRGVANVDGASHAQGPFSPLLESTCVDLIRRHPRFDALERAFLSSCLST